MPNFIHSKVVNFQISTAGIGTSLTDISEYCDKVDFPQTSETAETSCFGNTNKTFIAGLKTGTISLDGYWDINIDSVLDSIVGTIQSFQYMPQGLGSGNIVYTGNVLCTSYSPPGDITAAVKFTSAFNITGPVTRSIQS